MGGRWGFACKLTVLANVQCFRFLASYVREQNKTEIKIKYSTYFNRLWFHSERTYCTNKKVIQRDPDAVKLVNRGGNCVERCTH